MRTDFRHTTPTRSLLPARRQREHGQSAVEIALMLPLLMILVFGIITSGFMFYAYIQVSNGAREGARAASLYRTTMGSTGDSLATTVHKAVYDDKGTSDPSDDVSALGGLPVAPANPSVSVSTTGTRPGDKVTVTVIYSYTQPILSSFVPIFPQPMVIQRTIVMEMQ